MPTRTVTVLCLIQMLALVGAALLVAKLAHFPGGTEDFDWTGYNGLWFFRRFSLLFLLIPLVVAIICARLTVTHRDIAMLGPDGFYFAVVATILVVILCLRMTSAAMSLALDPIR
jgi:hypothetical protein